MKKFIFMCLVVTELFVIGHWSDIGKILAVIGLVVLLIAGVVLFARATARKKTSAEETSQKIPPEPPGQTDEAPVEKPHDGKAPAYRRKHLLTKNEWAFYKKLKPIADKYNLHVLSKIRMADLVEPMPGNDKSTWYRDFAKIKAKHVDFALANPENLYILLLIELDDPSHLTPSVTARDNFVDLVYASVGIPILHISSADNLEDSIVRLLKLEKKVETTTADAKN